MSIYKGNLYWIGVKCYKINTKKVSFNAESIIELKRSETINSY